MHQPAVPHRRKQKRKSKIEPQNPRVQIALRDRNRMPRPERNVAKDPAILPQRNLALGAPVEIVEYRFRHTLARNRTEVFNANHAG